MDLDGIASLQKEISRDIIKDPIFDVSDVLSNLSVLETTLALNTTFDFDDTYLIIGNKKQSGVQILLEERFDTKLNHVRVSDLLGESLGLGLGMALESNKKIVIMIDDFVMNYGKTFESLIQIAKHQPNIVIVYLEDEESLEKMPSSVDSFINSLRISKTYSTFKKDVRHLLSNPVGKPILSSLNRFKEGIKDLVLEPTIFNQFGFQYYGLINGQSYKDCVQVFQNVYDMETPSIIHIKTNVKALKNLQLPKFKTDDEMPETYSNYIDAYDSVLSQYDDITVCVDISKSSEHMAEFAITHPDHYYVSTGAYQSLVDFTKGLLLFNKKVVFILDSSSYKYISSLIEDQFYNTNNLLIILRNSGLSNESLPSNQGVYDVSNSALFSNNIFMGRNINESTEILKILLDKETFPLSFLRIPNSVEPFKDYVDVDPSWVVLNKEITPKSVIFSYGPNVERVYQKVTQNNLKIWVVNCRNVLNLDQDLLKEIEALNIPVCIYDLEDLHHTLYKSIVMYSNFSKVHNIGLQREYLQLKPRDLKNKYALGVDHVLDILPK